MDRPRWKIGADEKGAVEEEMQKITVIKGDEVLGYTGESHEEHSGEPCCSDELDEMEKALADIPDDLAERLEEEEEVLV